MVRLLYVLGIGAGAVAFGVLSFWLSQWHRPLLGHSPAEALLAPPLESQTSSYCVPVLDFRSCRSRSKAAPSKGTTMILLP